MKQIWTVPLFPEICGLCQRISKNSLCKKCEKILKENSELKIINTGEKIENSFYDELMYIFGYKRYY